MYSMRFLVLAFSLLGGAVSHAGEIGEPVAFAERGFSIQPPAGWETITNYPRATVVFQAPEQKELKYRRTIQVMSYKDQVIYDRDAGEELSKFITEQFTEASSGIVNYRIRNILPVTLGDGNEGLLLYAAFEVDGFALMQAHLAISSASHHFLITYTDLAEHFETETGAEDFLAHAWSSMGSIRVDALPRRSLPLWLKASAAGAAAALAVAGIWKWRRRERESWGVDGKADAEQEPAVPKAKARELKKEIRAQTVDADADDIDDDIDDDDDTVSDEYDLDDEPDDDEKEGDRAGEESYTSDDDDVKERHRVG